MEEKIKFYDIFLFLYPEHKIIICSGTMKISVVGFEESFELCGVEALLACMRLVDDTCLYHAGKLLIEAYHSDCTSCLDSGLDKMHLIITDHCLDGVGSVKYLKCRNTSRSVCSRDKGLRNDADEGRGKLRSDLTLLVSGEYVDDTVDGIGCGRCMKR